MGVEFQTKVQNLHPLHVKVLQKVLRLARTQKEETTLLERMARILLFCLIFTQGIVSLAMADEPRTSALRAEAVPPAAISPVGEKAETGSKTPVITEAQGSLRPVKLNRETQQVPEGETEESEEEAHEIAEAPENRKMGKHKRSSDKSAAGGGVIIGGLATAILAAVFCYIRVTRRKHSENPV